MKPSIPSFRILLIIILTPSLVFSQWSSKINISPGAMSPVLNENSNPCLAHNGDTLHVVWSDHRTQGYAIYYTHSTDAGLNWSTAIAITDTAGSATFPTVAVSGLSVHIVWLDSLLGVRASFYRRSLDGGNTWQQAICIDSNTKFWPGVVAEGNMVFVTLNKEVAADNTEVFLTRSLDNGVTWEAEQQISNATNRSEDPAIAVLGSYVHLSWNDKRSGTMNIYYRRSTDAGITWGPETQLTTADSYTSMVSLDGSNVDVPHGETAGGNFNVWIRQSSDTGATFSALQELTSDPASQVYPYLARDGMNLHLVYPQFPPSSSWYLHSGDGGLTWDSAFFLSTGGIPFITITGCALHVILGDSGRIYYMRNPTGNCIGTAALEINASTLTLTINPNPFSTTTTLNFTVPEKAQATLKIFSPLGNEVACLMNKERISGNKHRIIFDASTLEEGIYFCCLTAGDLSVVRKLVLIR